MYWAKYFASTRIPGVDSIGVMRMGGTTLRGVAKHPKVKITALCDVDATAMGQAATDFPDAMKIVDWRELLSKHADKFDAVTIGPGSFYTSLMPIFLVRGVADALQNMKGPIILIANLLTEGRGMTGFTAADAVARIEEAIHRPVDVVITNMKWPPSKVLGRYFRASTR